MTLSTSMQEPFVTTEDVAGFLGKPPSWIHNNAHKVGLPRYRVGTQLRYRLSEVAAWMEGTNRVSEGKQ